MHGRTWGTEMGWRGNYKFDSSIARRFRGEPVKDVTSNLCVLLHCLKCIGSNALVLFYGYVWICLFYSEALLGPLLPAFDGLGESMGPVLLGRSHIFQSLQCMHLPASLRMKRGGQTS